MTGIRPREQPPSVEQGVVDQSGCCGSRIFSVGNGQDRPGNSHAVCRAPPGFGFELVGNAGRPGSDNEGGLAGACAPAQAEEVKRNLNKEL